MMNLAPRSVDTYRHKIRKKMGVSSKNSLSAKIESL